MAIVYELKHYGKNKSLISMVDWFEYFVNLKCFIYLLICNVYGLQHYGKNKSLISKGRYKSLISDGWLVWRLCKFKIFHLFIDLYIGWCLILFL